MHTKGVKVVLIEDDLYKVILENMPIPTVDAIVVYKRKYIKILSSRRGRFAGVHGSRGGGKAPGRNRRTQQAIADPSERFDG